MEREKEVLSSLCLFRIEGQNYGVPLCYVEEIIGFNKISLVPLGPTHVEGILSFRGQVTTVINLRKLLDIKGENKNSLNIIIKKDDLFYSMMADDIFEIINTEENDFLNIDNGLSYELRKYLKSIYKFREEMFAIIDIEKML